MKSKLSLGLFFILILGAISAQAGTSTLTGTINDSSGNGINGTLLMYLPIPAQDPTSGAAISPIPISFKLVNGAISGGVALFDVSTINPQGLYYVARAYDTTGTLVFYGNYRVTGPTFNLGTAVPTVVTTSNVSYATPVVQSPITSQSVNGQTFTVNNTVYLSSSGLTSASINSALTSACNGTVPGAVVLPPGAAISLSAAISVPNNCTFGGLNSSFPVQLNFSSSINGPLVTSSSVGLHNHIHDLIVDGGSGTGGSQSGVSFSGAGINDVYVERVTVQNVGAYGFNLGGTSGTAGSRVTITHSKVINAGLSTNNQMYGIVLSFVTDAEASYNEITGTDVRTGIVAFSTTNANSATPIRNLRIIGNDIHDIDNVGGCPGDLGTGIDVGRVNGVVVDHNILRNVNCGGGIFFESVWNGTIKGNQYNATIAQATQGAILFKIPDTTQSGEVSNADDVIDGNTIYQPSGGSGLILIQSAFQALTITNNTLIENQLTGSAAIWLQMATADANVTAGNFAGCYQWVVSNNTVLNLSTLVSNTTQGIYLLQNVTNQIPTQGVVSGNTVKGFNNGIAWQSASASNGLTQIQISGNILDGNNNGLTNGDGKTYSSLYYTRNILGASGGILNDYVLGAPTIETEFGATPSGVVGSCLRWPDSATNRWKFNCNNGGPDFFVGDATTDTLTNKTLATPVNGLTTAGQSVPIIVAVTSQKSETAADANVLTLTPPATAGRYHIAFTMVVSAANAATLGWTAAWTDSAGLGNAPVNIALYQTGVALPALTFTTSATGDYFGYQDIDINNSATPIVIKLTFSGTSFTAKVSATIERII